jgi:hypothetical protein
MGIVWIGLARFIDWHLLIDWCLTAAFDKVLICLFYFILFGNIDWNFPQLKVSLQFRKTLRPDKIVMQKLSEPQFKIYWICKAFIY